VYSKIIRRNYEPIYIPQNPTAAGCLADPRPNWESLARKAAKGSMGRCLGRNIQLVDLQMQKWLITFMAMFT
jgi:hypothetical protein